MSVERKCKSNAMRDSSSSWYRTRTPQLANYCFVVRAWRHFQLVYTSSLVALFLYLYFEYNDWRCVFTKIRH